MNPFNRALVTPLVNPAYTTNGMKTNSSSGDPCVDLFFAIAASRGKDMSKPFMAALAFDDLTALKILLWARDVREGAGERETFRSILRHLETHAPQDLRRILPYIPFFGRWDDLLIFTRPDIKSVAYSLILHALINERNALCAKWMPREDSKNGGLARELMSAFELSERQYRKLIAGLSNTVEQKMSARQWDSIDFGKLPSLAARKYQNAFNKRCTDRYNAYKEALKAGKAKVNAGAIYPHDVLSAFNNGDAVVAEAQWNALPNYLSDKKIAVVADVSGSMSQHLIPGQTKLRPMDISIALGLYIADKQPGPFKDMVITFSENPQFVSLRGSIQDKYRQIKSADWGGSTNLEGTFIQILRHAVANQVRQEDMPEYIMILSDMEFNQACNPDHNAMQAIRQGYEQHGYKVPNIIFWNLNARMGNVPARATENGTVLVSGFSPSIIKPILNAEIVTPRGIMMQTIGQERYNLPL